MTPYRRPQCPLDSPDLPRPYQYVPTFPARADSCPRRPRRIPATSAERGQRLLVAPRSPAQVCTATPPHTRVRAKLPLDISEALRVIVPKPLHPDDPMPNPAAPAESGAALPESRLAGETSPYLLQHKHNPVDWRPWGPEALAEAQR